MDENGLAAYCAVADELLDGVTEVGDLDVYTVAIAREFAEANDRKWPPTPVLLANPQ